MKILFLIFGLFYLSSAVYSQSGSVTVSGAGVPEINSTYTFYYIGSTGRPEYRVGGNSNQRIAFVLPANKWAMIYNDPAPGTGLRYCNNSQAMDVPITGWYACNEGYTPVPSSIVLTPLPVKIKIKTTNYPNLNLAINAAQPNDTIHVIEDFTETLSIPLPQDVILNIPSSKTVTLNGSFTNNGTIINNGTLIKSTLTNNVNGMYLGNGTFTGNFINNGTFKPGG